MGLMGKCPAMSLNSSNETETANNATSAGFSCSIRKIFNLLYLQQSTAISDLSRVFHHLLMGFELRCDLFMGCDALQ